MPPPPAGASAQQRCRRGNVACTTHSFSCICCVILPSIRAAVAVGRLSSGDVFAPAAGSAVAEPGPKSSKSSRIVLDAPVTVVSAVGLFNVPANCNWAPQARCFLSNFHRPVRLGTHADVVVALSGLECARCLVCQLPELFVVSQFCIASAVLPRRFQCAACLFRRVQSAHRRAWL